MWLWKKKKLRKLKKEAEDEIKKAAKAKKDELKKNQFLVDKDWEPQDFGQNDKFKVGSLANSKLEPKHRKNIRELMERTSHPPSDVLD